MCVCVCVCVDCKCRLSCETSVQNVLSLRITNYLPPPPPPPLRPSKLRESAYTAGMQCDTQPTVYMSSVIWFNFQFYCRRRPPPPPPPRPPSLFFFFLLPIGRCSFCHVCARQSILVASPRVRVTCFTFEPVLMCTLCASCLLNW